MRASTKAQSIDEYIAAFTPDVQAMLQKIRTTVAKAVPKAQEKISYGIPAFALDGDVIYFAAFKKHIGVFPPVGRLAHSVGRLICLAAKSARRSCAASLPMSGQASTRATARYLSSSRSMFSDAPDLSMS